MQPSRSPDPDRPALAAPKALTPVLLGCDSDPSIRRRDGRERVRLVVAHVLYGRVAAAGDQRAALRAMGEFYAVTACVGDGLPLGVLTAVGILSAPGPGEAPASERQLLVAAERIGCIVVDHVCRRADAADDHAALLAAIEGRWLDRRLGPLLARTFA